jgi:hypothetical protein
VCLHGKVEQIILTESLFFMKKSFMPLLATGILLLGFSGCAGGGSAPTASATPDNTATPSVEETGNPAAAGPFFFGDVQLLRYSTTGVLLFDGVPYTLSEYVTEQTFYGEDDIDSPAPTEYDENGIILEVTTLDGFVKSFEVSYQDMGDDHVIELATSENQVKNLDIEVEKYLTAEPVTLTKDDDPELNTIVIPFGVNDTLISELTAGFRAKLGTIEGTPKNPADVYTVTVDNFGDVMVNGPDDDPTQPSIDGSTIYAYTEPSGKSSNPTVGQDRTVPAYYDLKTKQLVNNWVIY